MSNGMSVCKKSQEIWRCWDPIPLYLGHGQLQKICASPPAWMIVLTAVTVGQIVSEYTRSPLGPGPRPWSLGFSQPQKLPLPWAYY